jgi:hypothetical protein
MPKKRRFAIVLAVMSVSASACSYVLRIKIEEWRSGAPHFSLRENSIPVIGRCPDLRGFGVYPRSGDSIDYKSPLWQVSLHEGVRTCELTYGVVPSGFPEAPPPKALEVGREYHASAYGWGSGGSLDFAAEAD